MFYYFFRFLGRVFWRIFTGHYIAGKENIPRDGGVILASNHVSFLDPPLIAMGLPGRKRMRQVNFMARDTLFRNPIFGWLIRGLNTFPVKRGGADRDAWREFQRRVDDGRVVLFFPEGTRSADGALQPANPGSGMLVHRCKNATVIPVRVFGAHEMWPRGKGWKGLCPTAVTFGPPVDLSREIAGKGGREAYQAIGDKIMDAISKLEPHPHWNRIRAVGPEINKK